MHVTEKPGITTLASGIAGSRENAVTRTPSHFGHWYHSNNLSPHSPSVAELPRLYSGRPILGVCLGRGCRQRLFPQPSNRCPGLSSLVQLKCCAMCEPVPTARGHGYAGELGPKPPVLLSGYPGYLPPLTFPVP